MYFIWKYDPMFTKMKVIKSLLITVKLVKYNKKLFKYRHMSFAHAYWIVLLLLIIFIPSLTCAQPVLLRIEGREISRLTFSKVHINWHHWESQRSSHRLSWVSDLLSMHMRLLLQVPGPGKTCEHIMRLSFIFPFFSIQIVQISAFLSASKVPIVEFLFRS